MRNNVIMAYKKMIEERECLALDICNRFTECETLNTEGFDRTEDQGTENCDLDLTELLSV